MGRRAGLAAWILGVAGLTLASAPARADEWFVAPDGDDAQAGTRLEPFGTLERAQDAAEAGDTVWVRGGEYRFEGTVQTVGVAKGLTVRGVQQEVVGDSWGVRVRGDDNVLFDNPSAFDAGGAITDPDAALSDAGTGTGAGGVGTAATGGQMMPAAGGVGGAIRDDTAASACACRMAGPHTARPPAALTLLLAFLLARPRRRLRRALC